MPWWTTGYGYWDRVLSKEIWDRAAIALQAGHSPSPPQLILPKLPKVLLMWAIGVVCCGKSGAKIRFGSFCVRKATVEGKLKTRPCVE
ncbi:hypothetical protein [Nostoc sp.]|uniref:hypothetical protein n=1 Tax=Nostoc sp. TaxID=1180 RepID=UPI002FF902CA